MPTKIGIANLSDAENKEVAIRYSDRGKQYDVVLKRKEDVEIELETTEQFVIIPQTCEGDLTEEGELSIRSYHETPGEGEEVPAEEAGE